MRLSSNESLALARQLSVRAGNADKSEGDIASNECRLLVAILEGQTQDVLDLGTWLGQRARFWEQRGDHDLAFAFRQVRAVLNAG